MRRFLARFLALVLTVLPWAATALPWTQLERPEPKLQSEKPPTPRVLNAVNAPNFDTGSREMALPPSLVAFVAPGERHAAPNLRPSVVSSRDKLFLTYSRLQLEGG
ncbi:MAG: hypothetical protein HC933_06645 [Pleurocapsa sp. SU_196_0]|nr:hypothetical protein [Pleurocapsa sp. SU_196_0]